MQGQRDEVPAAPVFVDPSGRRSRRMQRVLWALSGLLGCYLVLVTVSLLGTPGLSRLAVPGVGPVLPGPAAPRLGTTTGARRAPARLLPPAVSPSPRPTSTKPTASPVSTPAPGVSVAPRLASPVRTPSPSVVPSPSPTGPPRATPTTAASPAPASNRASPRNSRAPSAHPSRQPR